MAQDTLTATVELPAGVTATYDAAKYLAVKGAKTELRKRMFHHGVQITTKDGITFTAPGATLREKRNLFAFVSHAKNMVKGVTEGFSYKLKICSGHFPMSVAVKGEHFEVKNFIGEKVPRVLSIKKGVKIEVNGADVVVSGADLELVSQAAADIEQLTRRPGFDTRIFQDGIFIVEKDGRSVS